MAQSPAKIESLLDFCLRKCFERVDGHSFALFRILFGLLMLIDLQDERAFSKAHERWSDPAECRFPLFEWIKPLPGHYMCLLYFFLFLGALGITLGYKFRICSIVYSVIFWYIFLLDKSYWNNHTYLFGLISIMISVSDANNCWSLDKGACPDGKVPFWQYFLLRFQISLVYFLAGVKKCNCEWIGGHSMRYLSEHWVFMPFRLVLDQHLVDLVVVHWGGFLIDSSVGLLFWFDSTRLIGYFFCALFNLMNSRMFAIGMFPYVMLVVLPIYSSPDWPIKAFNWISERFSHSQISSDLVEKFEISQQGRSEEKQICNEKPEPKVRRRKNRLIEEPKKTNNSCIQNDRADRFDYKLSLRQKFVVIFLISFITFQIFLPFSHDITKGFNTWTDGIYGYSWDMMVHNWKVLDKKITIKVNPSKQELYLNVEKWSPNNRWTHHADMAKQFANCIADKLRHRYNLSDISIYMDVWISLNGRFVQRVFDPSVDLLAADWSPFRKPSFVMPLIDEFTDWRSKLRKIEDDLMNSGSNFSVVFMADFPGFSLTNYVDPAFTNLTLHVFKGWIKIEVENEFTRVMQDNDSCFIPAGRFCKITVLRSTPASYLFIYYDTNSTLDSVGHNEAQTKHLELERTLLARLHKCIKITYESITRVLVDLYSLVAN